MIWNTLPVSDHPQHLELLNARAVDGDTVIGHLKLPLGILAQRRIRLKGFYAPEKRGANPAAADAARQCLQDALDTHKCHIQCHGMREDRYGRLAATLLLNGRAVHGGLVLGQYQLDAAAHAHDLAIARAVKAGDVPL